MYNLIRQTHFFYNNFTNNNISVINILYNLVKFHKLKIITRKTSFIILLLIYIYLFFNIT
jgi:hypothetical protein